MDLLKFLSFWLITAAPHLLTPMELPVQRFCISSGEWLKHFSGTIRYIKSVVTVLPAMPVVSGPLLCFGLDIRLILLHHVAQPVFHHLRDDCALK